jgi:hypothetical protein
LSLDPIETAHEPKAIIHASCDQAKAIMLDVSDSNASIARDIGADMGSANEAYRLYETAMLEFSSCCARFDWVAAEKARERAEHSHNSFLDHMAAAYKRIESL